MILCDGHKQTNVGRHVLEMFSPFPSSLYPLDRIKTAVLNYPRFCAKLLASPSLEEQRLSSQRLGKSKNLFLPHLWSLAHVCLPILLCSLQSRPTPDFLTTHESNHKPSTMVGFYSKIKFHSKHRASFYLMKWLQGYWINYLEWDPHTKTSQGNQLHRDDYIAFSPKLEM